MWGLETTQHPHTKHSRIQTKQKKIWTLKQQQKDEGKEGREVKSQ